MEISGVHGSVNIPYLPKSPKGCFDWKFRRFGRVVEAQKIEIKIGSGPMDAIRDRLGVSKNMEFSPQNGW